MSAGTGRITEGEAKAVAGGLSPVLRTKIVPPATNRVRIERGRLLSLLQVAADHRLILLKAPAGYGKTTLAVDWRERLQRSTAVTAWLALDDGDNDPGTLAYHLG